MRKILFFSDSHCGNDAGLSPIDDSFLSPNTRDIQIAFYEWFYRSIKENGPYDGMFALGDLTDGEGKKGQLDTYLTNVDKQADCAASIIDGIGIERNHIWLVRGTPFHTAGVLEYEDLVAQKLGGGCTVENIAKRRIEGWNIHAKHVSGRSDIPYGQGTPLLKELDRLEGEAFREEKEAPDVIARGHVHYQALVSKHHRQAFNCPALELPLDGTNSRRYSAAEYDVGFVVGYFEEGNNMPYLDPIIMPLRLIKDNGYECVNW